MKRALYEWGGILFAMLSVTCGTYWCISRISDKANFAMVLDSGGCILVGDGQVIWTGWFNTPASIDEFDQGQFKWPNPPIDVNFSLLGVSFRKLTWTAPRGPSNEWMLRVSLVLPTLVSALLAIFCVWRYRRLRLAAVGRTASREVSSGKPNGP